MIYQAFSCLFRASKARLSYSCRQWGDVVAHQQGKMMIHSSSALPQRIPWRVRLKERRKWSRRKKVIVLILASGIGASITDVLTKPEPVGPIYSFEEDRLPLRYDVSKINAYWDDRPLEILGRAAEILSALLPLLSKILIWEYLIRGKIADHPGLQKKYAIQLRKILTALGPCFIKFGQALAIRPDLLPSTVLFELQKLCDEVPSFPTADALRVMGEELGGDPQVLFEGLGPETAPIAAASLGQVYKLRLASTGEMVAVKVQRPDMLSFVLKDLYIMRKLAQALEAVKKVLTNQRPFDVALLDTFATASLFELDYLNEAQNQERFRSELVSRLRDRIYIPKVFPEHTTTRVLVSEWIEGEKLAQSHPSVINRLTPFGVECFLIQLLELGYFHADPHPGNLLVTKDGKLALIDFGLCAAVPLPDTKNITLAIVHLMQGDVGGLIQDAIALGFLPDDINVEKLQPELQKIFDNAQLAVEEETRAAQIEASRYKAVVKRRKKFLSVSYDLNKVFFEYPFLVPDYFALITRAMIVLEGIAVTGDPEFDLFNAAYPYALQLAVNLFGVSNLSQIASEAVMQMRKRNVVLDI